MSGEMRVYKEHTTLNTKKRILSSPFGNVHTVSSSTYLALNVNNNSDNSQNREPVFHEEIKLEFQSQNMTGCIICDKR